MEFNRKTSRIRTLYFDKPTDIIITDPCYYTKDEDWHEPSWGPKFSESFATDTLYGDWSCGVFKNGEKNNKIGDFCADSGMVAVAPLNEVFEYNPNFKSKLRHSPFIATIIKNFEGEIRFYKETCEYFSPYDFKWSGVKKGDIQQDRGLYIVGIGKINFITAQTGL